MDFTKIPDLVIDSVLLPFLDLNELLRLRRVCKATRTIVDKYLQLNVTQNLAPEIEITEEGKRGMKEFLKLDIPATKIFFNNPSGYEFYRDKKKKKFIGEFLERYGSVVKHLRVTQISTFLCKEEWLFFVAFSNLESLEAQFIGGWDERKVVSSKLNEENVGSVLKKMQKVSVAEIEMRPPLPQSFSRLRSLKLGHHHKFSLPCNVQLHKEVLKMCICLEHAAFPFYSCPLENTLLKVFHLHDPPDPKDSPMAYYFSVILSHMEARVKESHLVLKSFDFLSFQMFVNEAGRNEQEWKAGPYFKDICSIADKLHIQLLNVGASWFKFRDRYPYDYIPPNLGNSVISLIGIHRAAFRVSMPNLEKVEIQSSLFSCPGENWRGERPDWPSLKTLKLNIDSTMSYSPDLIREGRGMQLISYHATPTDALFQFFFQDVTRHAMTTLELQFATKTEPHSLVVPKVEDIVMSCPNLKKLRIVNWPGTNEELTKFWRHPRLEQVALEYCKDLDNVAFIGMDAGNPEFLKLTKLRKLTLKGLDQMPKITDSLFSLVIRHMKLTNLILTSDKPLKSITLDGVRSLLGGDFATAIQTFPFGHWSLKKSSKAEIQKLERLFRSYNML